MDSINITTGKGKYIVELTATLTGEGILVLLVGGERPHIGAVVLSTIRPSLSNGAGISCSSWVTPLLGHKDDQVAKAASERISCETSQATVVVAGLHIENATPEDIDILIANCDDGVSLLLEKIKATSS